MDVGRRLPDKINCRGLVQEAGGLNKLCPVLRPQKVFQVLVPTAGAGRRRVGWGVRDNGW